MIKKTTNEISFPDSFPKSRQEYYLNLVNEFHSLVNLCIVQENTINTLSRLSTSYDEYSEE